MVSPGIQDLSNEELRRLVDELMGEVARLRERVCELKEENASLKDEVARLKRQKGRPKLKPSGIERGTIKPWRQHGKKEGSRPSRQKLVVNEEHKLEIMPPPDARFKGYDDFLAQALRLEARIIRYRRERWQTADGKTPLVENEPPR